jgi:hypothetical protein
LDEVEPVVVGPCEIHVGAPVHVQRGRDVEHTQSPHARRKIKRQPVRDTAAAIVAAQEEIIHTELVEQARHILRHGAFAVVAVIGQARRMR